MVTKRDPDGTRARILAAARAEFAAWGRAGARVDRLAAAAGVNKRMIYHYFGSKDGLYAALLEAHLGRVGADTAEAAAGGWAAGLGRTAEPDLVRLLMWEALEQGTDGVVGEAERTSAWRALAAAFAAALPREQGPEPSHRFLAAVAVRLFPLAFPQLTRMITGLAPDDAELAALSARLFAAADDPAEPRKPRYRLTPTVT